MINHFLTQAKLLIKKHNKKNPKNKLDNKNFDKIRFNHYILEIIDDLVVTDILFDDLELHIRLVSFIDSILNIDAIAKEKTKHVKAMVDDLEWLVQYHKTNIYSDEENQAAITEFDKYIYGQVEVAKMCVNKYVNLLLSKTIDYLPRQCHQEFDKLENTIALFDEFKNNLYKLAESEFILWVYPFTENLRYVPIRLRYLDPINGLGTRVEFWVEDNAFTPLTEYLNGRGFDVFSGWGDLSARIQNQPQPAEVVKPVENVVKPVEKRPVTKQAMDTIIKYAAGCTNMYIQNRNVNMNNIRHQEAYIYTLAIPISHYGANYDLTKGNIKTILKSLLERFKRSKYYRDRFDRKMWFIDAHIDVLFNQVNRFKQDPMGQMAANIAMHCFDICSLPSKEIFAQADSWDDALVSLHQILARAHNELYHSETKYTNEQIHHLYDYFTKLLAPIYISTENNKGIVEKEKSWVFNSAIEFLVNVRDDKRADNVYEGLQMWLTKRNSFEQNQKLFESLRDNFMLLSYQVKERLLKLLDDNPIEIVNYGKSKEMYTKLYEIIFKDVKIPIKEGRVQEIQQVEEN